MLQRLSSRLLFDKIIILIFCLIALPYWLYNYPDIRNVCFLAIPVIGVISYFVFFFSDTIEFDEEKMYLIRRNGSHDVDLKDIYLIKMTGFRIGYRNLGKIKYMIDNEEHTARFYSRYFSIYFNDFCNLVKVKNPKVNIDKPWWLSF